MKDIYCKIAEWIVSQNIDRAVNSTDIKEIADYVFNVQIKSTGVLKVKECLREKGVTVKDAKFKDAFYDHTNNLFEPVVDFIYKNWMTIYSDEYIHRENIIVQNDGSYVFKSNEPNFVYIRFSGSRKEMFLRPYAYIEFYDGLKRIKIDGWKLKTVSKKKVKPRFRQGEEYYEISSITYERNSKPIKDAKIKDKKYIVYLNGEPYYTAKSYDEAMRIESQLYSASDTEDDFQSYYGSYPDVEIKELNDCEFRDALRVKQFRIVEVDKKTKEVIAVHPWVDLTNSTSSNILIIEKERNRYRNTSNYPEEISYKVEYQWEDGTPIGTRIVKDAKFKDSYKSEDIKGLYDEGMYVEDIHDILDKIYPNYINTESLDDVPDKIWDKVYDALKKRLRERYKENPNDVLTKAIGVFNLDDCKIKDSKPTLWGAKAYDVEKECWVGFCKYIDTESGKEASKILENEVPFPYSKYRFLGSYYKLPEHFIKLDDCKFKDSKLTRKQKMWYGEELENLIYPQYLRRNYQKRKTRRRKK